MPYLDRSIRHSINHGIYPIGTLSFASMLGVSSPDRSSSGCVFCGVLSSPSSSIRGSVLPGLGILDVSQESLLSQTDIWQEPVSSSHTVVVDYACLFSSAKALEFLAPRINKNPIVPTTNIIDTLLCIYIYIRVYNGVLNKRSSRQRRYLENHNGLG